MADAVNQSTRAVQIARTQYENGLVDLLPVLDAQRVQLNSQIELTQSQTELVTSLVSLFKALGGGWDEVVVEKKDPAVASLPVVEASAANKPS